MADFQQWTSVPIEDRIHYAPVRDHSSSNEERSDTNMSRLDSNDVIDLDAPMDQAKRTG